MLVLPGCPALSSFRLTGLLSQLRQQVPALLRAVAYYRHFIELDAALTGAERSELERLLNYGSNDGFSGSLTELTLLVVPRPGTLSPWSSKATDIARQCGLGKVRRIERGVAWTLTGTRPLSQDRLDAIAPLLHDRMTQVVLPGTADPTLLFTQEPPRPLQTVAVQAQSRSALTEANRSLALALADDEIEYLLHAFGQLQRDPTDAELMMFAQANSEHCRHKIFNARWTVDGEPQPYSLFAMIRHTREQSPNGVLSAYRDNAAVIAGHQAARLFPDPADDRYRYHNEPVHILLKVETHNHPTAVSPYPGAATGAGGEIRDEGATGRGARPKAGLVGYSVSHLRIPEFRQPWEQIGPGRPQRIASALQIMLEAPVGAAAYNNEFGRPALCGYFRTFEHRYRERWYGYHKPIMIAGGLGNIRAHHVSKAPLPAGTPIVVLGGPAMLIGLGGGAASSQASGRSEAELDFASVQRDNAEMQRRCQEVIDCCWALGEANPILSIHDVGAGGLSNALPELVHDAGRGGHFELRQIPSADPGMSPRELWCNEAQERYVLAITADALTRFAAICARERCPHAVLGTASGDQRLSVDDRLFGRSPVDMPITILLGKPPRMTRDARREQPLHRPLDSIGIDIRDAARRILRFPAVAAKTFLITIGDRTVGGLVSRDQMVGPWQVPVADAAVTASGFHSYTGEAMAVGERGPVALLDPPASGRLAVTEAITNIGSAAIDKLGDIKLSGNWMAAAGQPGQDAALYDTVRAVAMELCPALGIAIPVGKDSLSMNTVWQAGADQVSVTAPVSLIVSAFAPVQDVRLSLTPQLRLDQGPTELLLIDLGRGKNRLGGSCLAQVYGQLGGAPPDLDNPADLKALLEAIQALNRQGLLLAYHDRSDGGLLATLCEMAFAGHCGISARLGVLGADPVAALFSEEPGIVVQIRTGDRKQVLNRLNHAGLDACSHSIGHVDSGERLVVRSGDAVILNESRSALHRIWAETSYRMQALRDDPECAREAFDTLLDESNPGLQVELSFDPAADIAAPFIGGNARPRVAVLREQGVNGQIEMAAAFDRAGFAAVDVHMSDLIEGRHRLPDFQGLAACGGFSYGDVLGAGQGWAKSILHNVVLSDQFAEFLNRDDRFALGVCNGCQMLAGLRELIPGAGHWPRFVRNRSEQFEARFSMVEVLDSPSFFFRGMAGSRLPIAVAHGEGRAAFAAPETAEQIVTERLAPLRFVDNDGRSGACYPANPNGSPLGLAGFTNRDGRVTILMPHPERVFRTVQWSWHPHGWGENAPWLRLFQNARVWLEYSK